MALVAGVDGIAGGWVAVVLDGGKLAHIQVVEPPETSFDELAEAEVLAVDVPIGFGPAREADALARQILRPCKGASRVFPIPAEETLLAALQAVRYRKGLGVQAQVYRIADRICHVTALAASDRRIYEVHPEISFWAIKGDCLDYSKHTYGGVEERRALLERAGILPEAAGAAARIGVADVLDAAAAAWSAHRILTGEASSLPSSIKRGRKRRPAIWY